MAINLSKLAGVVAVTLLATTLSGCAFLSNPETTPGPTDAIVFPVQPPEWAKGDQWKYEREYALGTDSWVWEATTEKECSSSGCFIVVRHSREADYNLYDLEVRSLAMFNDDGELHQPGIPFPLSENWSGRLSWGDDDYAGMVAGTEEITVPAGTFNTVVVELDGRDDEGDGVEYTFYYSPYLRAYAKVEITGHYGDNSLEETQTLTSWTPA